MVSKNHVLTAVQWTKMHRSWHAKNWNNRSTVLSVIEQNVLSEDGK